MRQEGVSAVAARKLVGQAVSRFALASKMLTALGVHRAVNESRSGVLP